MMKVFLVVVLSFVAVLHAASALTKENDKAGLEKIFYANSLTTTFTALSTLTSIIPYTCYTTAASTKACKGRKKRHTTMRFIRDTDEFAKVSDINSSLDDEIVNLDDNDQASQNKAANGKYFFTVWKTSITSMTVTSYSTNRAITLSILAACTHASFTALPITC